MFYTVQQQIPQQYPQQYSQLCPQQYQPRYLLNIPIPLNTPISYNIYSPIPEQNKIQQTIQLNKQKVEQKMDLEYNIYALGRALSKAELYAFRFSVDKEKESKIQPRFGYYNQFDNGNNFDKEQLFKSLVNSVKFLHYGFEETEFKYKEIMFPDNLKKEECIQYLEELKEFLKDPKDIRIYDVFINVLKRLELDFSEYKDLYNKNQKIDPKKLMESYPDINKAFEAKEKKWKKRIENDPEYKPKLETDKNYDENSEFKEQYYRRSDYK